MRGLAVMLCLVGCGRIGFGALGSGPSSGDGQQGGDGQPGGDGQRATSDAGDGGSTGTGTITWVGTLNNFIGLPAQTSITVPVPGDVQVGDVLVAVVGGGCKCSPGAPTTFTAPTGWTLVRRIDETSFDTSLAAYWYAMGTGSAPATTWTFAPAISGEAWISAYRGVDSAAPIEIDAGMEVASAGPSYATPSITPTSANAIVLASYATTKTITGISTLWTPPSGTVERADVYDGFGESGLGVEMPGSTAPIGALTATASTTQAYALVHVLALAPQ